MKNNTKGELLNGVILNKYCVFYMVKCVRTLRFGVLFFMPKFKYERRIAYAKRRNNGKVLFE